MSANQNIIDLYHGSDHIVELPAFGVGKPDNDYGSGFYTTRILNRASEWALLFGMKEARVNHYQIDVSDLNVLELDEYGPMAWIAEVIANRGVTSAIAREFSEEFVTRYKVNTSNADLIVGYRADDSYGDVIEAFMSGEITVEEVQRLFYKGELGEQYFIKSKKAFTCIKFIDAFAPELSKEAGLEINKARKEVLHFLQQRRLQIAKRFQVPEITVIDAITNTYSYNRELRYYERR